MLIRYITVRVQKYECRLRKSKTSSTAQDTTGNKILKQRHSSVQDQHQFHVQIKVSRSVDGIAITIQQLDEHTHTHDIEESFQIKKLSILANSIKAKTVKGYSASQIFHAIHGAGTAEGSERLEAIGESSLM